MPLCTSYDPETRLVEVKVSVKRTPNAKQDGQKNDKSRLERHLVADRYLTVLSPRTLSRDK